MSDQITAPETQNAGQPVSAPAGTAGTTEQTPASASGQAQDLRDSGTGQAVSSAPDSDAFFDPTKLPDELKGAYKQMQAAYTRKSQELARQRQKIDAYDSFSRDPIGSLQQLATQYGMSLTRAEAKQVVQRAGGDGDEWQPKTWDDVLAKAEERAEARLMQKFAPLMQNVQRMQANSIEQQLDSIDPHWRVYEDDMRRTIQEHPSLVKDVGKLYRLSVPEEVYTSRAVQAAIKKMESKGRQANVGSKTETPRSMPATRKVSSFQEAVDEAKRMLSEQGR
jgi:hypothetical protein